MNSQDLPTKEEIQALKAVVTEVASPLLTVLGRIATALERMNEREDELAYGANFEYTPKPQEATHAN